MNYEQWKKKKLEMNFSEILLAVINKYGILISQWAWLCQALLEVSMNKIALWIKFCADLDSWKGFHC